ncbi:FAD:protein FMN transferase [Paenibacillus rhizovicinus]|uniref:FAD:protein FMN transferase n=1 Tax=Paenibacillus rhizovicinus TaxID=2704463 RepID=A0A6C0NUK8_9BACL|nr:FAD:protein FMN transferase [Paenibacillus rhizovicinus]QHW29433.1 FAD:protein FMN transferase [Paenibacillus rhizovicinus]
MKKAKLFMDTIVKIEARRGNTMSEEELDTCTSKAFDAFRLVEQACSRFSPESELMQACRRIGEVTTVSPFLFEPLRFALEMAEWTDGLFDPTIGRLLEAKGFNRHYLTGERTNSIVDSSATYRDIELNETNRTLCLYKPLILDLGATAKGFAIDLAARELSGCAGFVVNAGGDLYAGGTNEQDDKWTIGIRNPAMANGILELLSITDAAVCTSGSYERRSEVEAGDHHIVRPDTEQSPNEWISCSVIAPYAMMADAFSTAAFAIGGEEGVALIADAGLQGLILTSDLRIKRIGGI